MKRQGATSVLILFMMIVLVTMGMFSITVASSNITFSKRLLEWNNNYYALDAQGESFLAELDDLLLSIQRDINHNPQINDADAAHAMYMQEAIAQLNAVGERDITIQADEYNDTWELIYDIHHNDTTLHIKLQLLPVNSPHRFAVLAWQQEQSVFDYSNTFEFWDGKID